MLERLAFTDHYEIPTRDTTTMEDVCLAHRDHHSRQFLFTHLQSTETPTHDERSRITTKKVFFFSLETSDGIEKNNEPQQKFPRILGVRTSAEIALFPVPSIWLPLFVMDCDCHYNVCVCMRGINRGNVQLIKAENTRKTASISSSSKETQNLPRFKQSNSCLRFFLYTRNSNLHDSFIFVSSLVAFDKILNL